MATAGGSTASGTWWSQIDAQALGGGYFVDGLDAAVEDYEEFHIGLLGILDALTRHSVALFVAVGDVVVDVGIVFLQESVYQCHGRHAVDIIVAIDHDALLAAHGHVQALYGQVHVGHEEGVVQVV